MGVPSRVCPYLIPSVPSTDYRSTMTLARIKILLKKNEWFDTPILNVSESADLKIRFHTWLSSNKTEFCSVFPIECISSCYSQGITRSQDCFHGNLENKWVSENISALQYVYFQIFHTWKSLYDMGQCFSHTGVESVGERLGLLLDSGHRIVFFVFFILLNSKGSLNVLSSAFLLIFVSHQTILLPGFSTDPYWIEAACIRPCSIQNPLGTSLQWGSSQVTRGFIQKHSNNVNVEYLSIGVSTWASAIFKSLRVFSVWLIHGRIW